MKKLTSGVLAGTVAAALAASLAQQPANAAPPQDSPSNAEHGRSAEHRPDNRPGPLTERQTKLRESAVQALASGDAKAVEKKGGGSVVELTKANGEKGKPAGNDTVEFFDNDKQANILSILSEFGGDGPVHNQIPEPDRGVDNSITWESDYNTAYYENLFNGDSESMKDFYLDASGGQYEVTNTVEDWVTVDHDGAYYGNNDYEDDGGAWEFIADTADAWYDAKKADLKSPKKLDEYLSQFDQWDRYDYDGDGDFNEPDGYIDHFQAIHAGEGEEAGASPDAIWSHRWYVNAKDFGKTGPTVNGQQVKFGGTRIGNSSYFIGDYTVEPENGGLGVFAHEFGHDLGLPDFYDTAGGENGTAFWTIMSSGSWLGHGEEANEGIGTTPGGFGPDEKAFLGWLDYETVDPGEDKDFTLAPAQGDAGTQAVRVNLPDKTTTDSYVAPYQGAHEWWSGSADDLNNTMAREVPTAGTVTVTAKAWYQIEEDYDYLYAEFSTDGGNTWEKIDDGLSGNSDNSWTDQSWTYTADGADSIFRFRYQTDGGVHYDGAFLDNIAISADGNEVITDDAEGGEGDWDVDGWKIIDGTDTNTNPQYYWIENRQYVGYDDTLRTGPYNFSEAYSRPDWVEFFSFQPGMLVWFADKSQPDNNTSTHPGYGQSLPVDARPEPFTYPGGTMPSNRRQPYDAVFGVNPIDPVCLHKEVLKGKKVQTLEACQTDTAPIPTFDDSDVEAYWSKKNPWNSTKVAGHGVTATVTAQDGDNLTVKVVNP